MKNHLLTAVELDKRSVAVGLKLIFVKSEIRLTATQCNVTSFIVRRPLIGRNFHSKLESQSDTSLHPATCFNKCAIFHKVNN